MTGDDYGIHIGGDAKITGSQVGSGRRVEQTQRIEAAPESPVAQSIARIADLLERHAGQVREPARARRDLEEIEREVAEPDPDPQRIRHALERLGSRVAAVAVLAEAVHALAAQLGL